MSIAGGGKIKGLLFCLALSAVLSGCISGRTQLIRAAGRCRSERVQAALDKGADVNAADGIGWTALHEAAYCSTDLVERLLLAGAEVNARDIGGDTPLHLAASIGATAVVEVLIAHGADVSLVNDEGQDARLRALEKGHYHTVAVLVSALAQANADEPAEPEPQQGYSPLLLDWGSAIEDFVSAHSLQHLERGGGDDEETLSGLIRYLGYDAEITYVFGDERGLVGVWLYIDETSGKAYRDVYEHLKKNYEPVWVYDVEQRWVGPREWAYAVIDMFYGTQVIFAERKWAEESWGATPGEF